MRFCELPSKFQSLLVAAQGAARNSYNKYSGYFVGSALMASDGSIHLGAFFENASGPVGVCAERIALGAAITAGQRHFSAIAIVGGPSFEIQSPPVTPCGICRQSLAEFDLDKDRVILVLCADCTLSNVIETSISELLPMSFSRIKE